MPKSDFIPSRDSAFLVWHDQYKTAAIAQAATVGLVAADTTAITADNTDIHARITASVAADAAARQATLAKQLAREAIVQRVRALARRIKAHPAYTPAIGAQLGIIGPEDTTDLTTSKPDLSGHALTGGAAEIQFNKSISDGVNLYSQRDGDAGFIVTTQVRNREWTRMDANRRKNQECVRIPVFPFACIGVHSRLT